MASSFSSSLMISSSSSSSPRNWRYNVFTSFHGPDVRIKFLSHLRKQFDYNGITMFDDNEIERSQTIGPALKTAIEESRIAIVVLSKNYASSSWCLDELLEILKCKEEIGQIVMTVFYEVDPSNVRKQTGDFGKAFNDTCACKLEQRQKWSHALTYVGNIAGEDFKNWPNEAKMIEKIARDVSEKVNATPCRDFNDMVGLDDHLRKMESLLDLDNSGVKIVGISGPSGIGKSTIARALHSRLSSKFQHNCFGDNLWEYYKIGTGGHGVKLRLHEQLLSKLFNQNGMQIKHLGVIQERLHDKKVLIILDEVESLDQLEVLANIKWFGPGSRIIVITANKEILQQHDISDIYHVGFPSEKEALMIFCISAFKQSSPPYGFTKLADEVVRICGKLPLGLRVLGSVLRRKSYANWIDELPRLKNSLDGRIENVLKLGYESLNEKDQSLFLSIAVFFNYEHVDHVTLMLAKSNLDVRLGLEILANKYLIHIDGSRVVMHHLLQVMARQVMTKQELWKRQILVDAREISYILEHASGKGSIVGVSFDIAEINKLMIRPRAFKRMCNILFLKVYNTQWYTRKRKLHIPEDIEFPRHIRLFHWDAYPGKRLPLGFCAENLVEFNMAQSKLEKLWEGKQPLPNLKKVNLASSSCLRELPDLSNATNLERLDLFNCSALVELPSSIANLRKLKDLMTWSCKSLEVIPTLINLTSLTSIDIKECSRLRSFPDIPPTIKELEVTGTAVEKSPETLRYCSHLEYVFLGDNENLKTFLTHLPTSVREIHLDNCGIERITDCISGLHNLTHLLLSSCKRLVSLPELPGSLEWLHADDCTSLESVSEPISTPNAELRFTNCIKLSRQARRAIIQGSFGDGCALLPGKKIPKEFDYRARGNTLTISRSTFNKFKVCVVTSPDEEVEYCEGVSVYCRWRVIGNSVKSDEITFGTEPGNILSKEHLFIFYISLPLMDPSEVSRKIVLKFSSRHYLFDIIECGVQILTDETDGSNNERYGDEYDFSDTHESDEASDKEEDDDSISNGTSEYESDEASDKEDDEDGYESESESGEASEEKDEGMGDEDDYESVSRKRLRKTSDPIGTTFSSMPMAPFTFPDSSAALGAPPLPPTYGFHMLERRTIALTDSNVHSYLALPPNYQPFHPEEFRDHPEGSLKRKYPGDDEIERAEILRQSQQFMNYANPNDQSVASTSNSPVLRDVAMLEKMMKQLSLSG